MSVTASTKLLIDYPDYDGEPMSDNTVQFDWIAILKWNADSYFRDDPLVFVAGDHLIYTVEGEREIRQAPDVYVVFGRPKCHRGSYQVWNEAGIFPQVIFEVWSPRNGDTLTVEKLAFYERNGAEEYYIIYPEFPAHVAGWLREGDSLVRVPQINGFVSPRLGFRFETQSGEVRIYGPDNKELKTPLEIARERDYEREQAELQRLRAEAEKQRADDEKQRADRLAAMLRELGVDVDKHRT